MSGHNTNTIGYSYGTIVSGTLNCPVAENQYQITTTSTPIGGIWVSADVSNSAGNILFVGNTATDATAGVQAGIQVVPGNPSIFIPIDNLNKIYVEPFDGGGALAYAYLQLSDDF